MGKTGRGGWPSAVTVPNLLSLLRMALIPLFVIAILEGEPMRALAIFVVAGVTDALDGALARLFGQQSLLGMYLDPAADKLLLVSAYVVLAIPGLHQGLLIPAWVTVLVIARDVLIVAVALILYVAAGIPRFPPTMLSKVNTVAQIACVVLVMLSGIEPVFLFSATISVYAVAILTIASGLGYVFRMLRLPSVKPDAGGVG